MIIEMRDQNKNIRLIDSFVILKFSEQFRKKPKAIKENA